VYYRVNVFIPILDEVVCGLEERFAKQQEQSFRLSILMSRKILSTNWEDVLAAHLPNLLPAVTKHASILKATVSTVKGEFVAW
jgi:hypothetical protein